MTSSEKYTQLVNERYCTCTYRTATTTGDFLGEHTRVRLERDTTACKLHDPSAEYDLPDGVL